MSFYDILLAKKLEDKRDPQVKGLTVTENGSYSESGTVYNVVNVNVELPDDALKIKSASGTIATFKDGQDLVMPKCEVEINAVQSGSGDPSPSNIRPISGFDGANVSVSGTNQFDKNATFVNAYCDHSNHIVSNNDMRSVIIPVKSGVSYRIITDGLSLGMNRYGYTKTYPQVGDALYNQLGDIGIEEFANNAVITVPNGFSYLFITFYRYNVATDSFDDVKNAFCINYPSTETSYHAYNGYFDTISWQTEAGTVYGGKVDLVSGVLTVDRGFYTISSGTALTGFTESSLNGSYAIISNIGNQKANISEVCAIASEAKSVSYNDRLVEPTINRVFTNEQGGVMLRASNNVSISDSTTFLSYFNGCQICYELATPITYQLNPTAIKSLLGNNNVFADTNGDVSLQYFSKIE